MSPEDEENVLRPRRMRAIPRERTPHLKFFTKRGVLATRTYQSRAIAKITHARFSRLKAGCAVGHIRYLGRESAQSHELGVDRSFGTASQETFLKPLPGEKRIFKIVLSPEEFFTLDPKLYVFSFMSRLLGRAGKWESGQSAGWRAYVHTNTANPHIHVVVHGITHGGKDLYFRPELYKDASPIATQIQDQMTGWFVISRDLARERQAVRQYSRMPAYQHLSLDDVIERGSGQKDWRGILEMVPFYRRKALHGRMVFLEMQDLLRQSPDGLVHVLPNFGASLTQHGSFLAGFGESAKLQYLASPPFELAHARTPTCFGLLTIYSRTTRTVILETTKDTAIVMQVPEEQFAKVSELARLKRVVRLKNGKPEEFRGDPRRLIRVALTSSGPVAREILSQTQTEVPTVQATPPKTPPQQSKRDSFGY